MRKQTNYEGFFSVEAALIMPIVLGVYVFLIVMLFLQYDRCLLEQDMASIMIKAGNYEGTPQQTMAYLQELTVQWERERYLWVKPQVPCFTVQGSKIRLEAVAEYTVPILGFSAEIGGVHRLEATYQLTAWDRPALVYVLVERQNNKEDEKENE